MKFIIRILLCVIVFTSCHNNKQNKSTEETTTENKTTTLDSLSVENDEPFWDSLFTYDEEQYIDTLPRGEYDGLWINLEYKELIAKYRSYGKATEHYINTDNFTSVISINRDDIEILAPAGGDFNGGILHGDTLNLLDTDYLLTRISKDTIKLSRENMSKLFVRIDFPIRPNYAAFLGQDYLGTFLLFNQKFKFINPKTKQSYKIAWRKNFTIAGHPRYVECFWSARFGKTIITLYEKDYRNREYYLFQEYDKGYLLQGINDPDAGWFEYNNNRYYIAKQAPDGTFYNEEDIKDSDEVEFVRSFLIWYKNNYDQLNKFDMVKGGYESDSYYYVDMNECRRYLNMFKASGYVSDKFINDWMGYFIEYQQYFKENKIDDGPPDGFDYDLILLTQETESLLKSVPYQMIIEETKRSDTKHTAVTVNLCFTVLIFELSLNDKGKWQLDKISNGYNEDDW